MKQAPAAPVVSIRGLSRRFGALQALTGIDLDVGAGEVLALCGDNGAGKSTLIRILPGAELPSAGEIRLNGEPVVFRSPQEALARGVAAIYQDLALAPRLSIRENVFMGAELTRPVLLPFIRLLDRRAMAREARELLARLEVRIDDVERPVESLSGGQRQAVAIARALRSRASLIIMDEPTAALGVRESAQVLELIVRLRDAGHSVILISHNMRDVAQVASRVVILKGGRKIEDRPVAGLTADDLRRLIFEASWADAA